MEIAQDTVEKLADGWRLDDVRLVGRGLEFTVYRARDAEGRAVVLRLAPRRFDSNANDPDVDTRALLVKEYEITRHLTGLGLPVAEPLHLHLADPPDVPDVLVSRYVDDDGSPLDNGDLGRLLARLHGLPAPRLAPAATGEQSCAEVIRARLERRWREVGRLVPDWPAPPDRAVLADHLASLTGRSLVHLDVRSANLRRHHGRVRALLDWSNALIADPVVEFARLTEYARYAENELDVEALRAGYATVREAPPEDATAMLACRLDTAVMLALVFLSEAPDPERGPPAAAHARELAERLTVRRT
ncbi:phosphotransferase family protein [Micromonospora siamensis]|uniref:Predicted kinase, aminoglycoside phosphotransferase (APT) family n=1 Tax=Micromonospora siamensis TaxID=299152 RepID=A0A1C5J694_9ACTN|nr:aminoglycoside phosphotransferase family protein [Micromonospora siamensis]SCG65689.1 Predicted kinase, aminoglycoside phosphotransferase (APT) family [Micromonospora siamensis]